MPSHSPIALTPKSSLRVLADAWLRHLQHLAGQDPPGRSAETVRRYRSALAHLGTPAETAEGQAFVLGDLSLDAITTPLVLDWLASVRPSSRAAWHGNRVAENTARVLRNLLYWARDRGLLQWNPAAHLRLRERPTAGSPLDEAGLVKYEAALRELDAHVARRAVGRGDLAKLGSASAVRVLLLLLETGLRVEEVAQAQVDDVKLAERTLHLRRTKGARPRLVALGPGAVAVLGEQLCHVGRASRWLYPSPVIPDAPIRHGAVWDTHHRACLLACLCRRFRPHDLRHQFVTDCLRRGHPHKIVGRLVGHTSEKTTQRYDHLVVHPGERAIVEDLHRARTEIRARLAALANQQSLGEGGA